MEKQQLIELRTFAFQCALQLTPVHIQEDGSQFACPDYDIYDASEEILEYLLTGKIPDDELKDLLKN